MVSEKSPSSRARVAIVTGAARPRGMGFAIANLLADEGAHVVLFDVAQQVHDRALELQNRGLAATAFQLDLASRAGVEGAVGDVLSRHGRIDALVNVAGGSLAPRPPFMQMDRAYWDAVFERNVGTTLNCCWAVLPAMRQQRYGRIVNISSITARYAYRYSAAYSAAKAAVGGLTRALALEMGEHGITVNAVLPGDIDTADKPWRPEDGRRDLGIFSSALGCPVPRPGQPTEIAAVVRFLVSEAASFLTGAEIAVDGGGTVVEPYPVAEIIQRSKIDRPDGL